MANGTFTYGVNTGNYNPPIDNVRMLIPDTVQFGPDGVTPVYIFSDQEILAFEQVVMGQFQSGMFFSTPGGPPGGGTLGAYLPSQPIPYYRVAGLMLQALAGNSARIAGVTKLLDVTLNLGAAAKALRDQAQGYFDMDNDSGAFVIVEQCPTDWAYMQRYWNQWARQTAS